MRMRKFRAGVAIKLVCWVDGFDNEMDRDDLLGFGYGQPVVDMSSSAHHRQTKARKNRQRRREKKRTLASFHEIHPSKPGGGGQDHDVESMFPLFRVSVRVC